MARILHVARAYPPYVGGVERVAEFLADAARAGGHDVTVLCSADQATPGRSVTSTGVVVERVPTLFSVGVMPVSPRLPGAIRALVGQADLVHFHEPYPLATLWLLLAPRPRRLVITWHADIYRQKILKPFAELVQHLLADRADAIFCTTERMADHSPFLRRHRDRVQLMPFMIDTAPFDALRADRARIEATRRRFGGRFALAFGRLVEYKGFGVLAEALAGTDIRLVLIGRGRLREQLEARARELGIGDRLVFVGAVDEPAARELLCAGEFFVFPSIHHNEGFGLVQLEAMAAGRPVINTWLPTSVPEVSLDGLSGFTVPPGDAARLREAMLKLWRDPELARTMGEAALARVQLVFDKKKVTPQIQEIYRRILAGSR